MNGITNWFIDFDDTLATGPTTWGLDSALPKLIREHNLPFNQAQYEVDVLIAQERTNREADLQPILDDLFDSQLWPRELQMSLLSDMQRNYRPSLFSDSIEFLETLQLKGGRVFILSNNPTAPDLAKSFGLGRFMAGYFTPKLCPGSLPKPDVSMWLHITSLDTDVSATNSALIGDDPWSDAAFAQQCGLAYWIVDRKARFSNVASLPRERLVTSLLQLTRLIA
jgi:FMN phosphatase YigB (HAD superfamily)